MKASELIAELQKLVDDGKDVEVVYDDWFDYWNIYRVLFISDKGTSFIVLIE